MRCGILTEIAIGKRLRVCYIAVMRKTNENTMCRNQVKHLLNMHSELRKMNETSHQQFEQRQENWLAMDCSIFRRIAAGDGLPGFGNLANNLDSFFYRAFPRLLSRASAESTGRSEASP